jgi:hypothetical protein
MTLHTHKFVEGYSGLVGFGLNRETNENTVKYYLQKFSDDQVLQKITKRLSDDELGELFDTISGLLRKHMTEKEYHRLFLKEDHH